MNIHILLSTAFALCISISLPSPAHAAFGGQPPLGPKDSLRHMFRPYDLVKLNYLGMNYCENLLDCRTDICSYTNLNSDSSTADAWDLQFPDDTGRILESIAWEDQFSPVARVEFARRLAKGIIASHIPGTRSYYFFRNRIAGKTFLIFDDGNSSKRGQLILSNWGDSIEGMLKVGLRVERNGEWLSTDKFNYTDNPEKAGTPGVARSARYWNESPFVFKRRYTTDDTAVDFTGKYWLSDEDMPLEFAFASKDSDRLDIVIGEPGKPMPLLRDANAPGIIHLPDRKTTFNSDKDGSKTFEKPGFRYFILRKATAWACPGYSTALLVVWEGTPDKVEALADNGYGEIRISYSRSNGTAGGKVWLYPFQWLNHRDMDYVYRNAESFLKTGKLIHNGFPSQQLVNAAPAGLAAAAYLLTKYSDPFAPTAQIAAENAVDDVFEAEEKDGMTFVRSFFPVRAAGWMLKLAKELHNKPMIAQYTRDLDSAAKRMMSPQTGYDGKGWPSGWDHFNCIKALWLAYDASGDKYYLEAYDRAQSVYTIDEKGIYRHGKPVDAPGGFETYAGSLTLAAWGNAGKLDYAQKLIDLDVPNGWHDPKMPVKDLWNDAGAGPWAQDDANPEYMGFSLRGAHIPVDKKYILPLGAFPTYDWKGKVEVTNQPILDNPYFPKASDKLQIIPDGSVPGDHRTTSVTLNPGEPDESKYLVRPTGTVVNGRRVCTGNQSLVYSFDTKDAAGAGLDLTLQGSGCQVEISPDGKRWYRRLDSWSERPERRSVDLSVLTGSRDELLKMLVITPRDDRKYLIEAGGSRVEREHCRYLPRGGAFIYGLDLKDVTECRMELLAGNGYRLQISPDGRKWTDVPDDGQVENTEPDAASLRFVDVTKRLGRVRKLYVRFSDLGDLRAFRGRQAFLRRLTVYGIFNSDKAFVRLSNVQASSPQTFEVGDVVFRKWAR